jgi:hypothetical protein
MIVVGSQVVLRGRFDMSYTVRRAQEEDLDDLVSFTLAEADEAEGVQKTGDVVRRGVVQAIEPARLKNLQKGADGLSIRRRNAGNNPVLNRY